MIQILSISPLLLALVIGFGIAVLIVVKCAQTYEVVNQNPKVYVAKAAIALSVWAGLSLFLMLFLAGYMMGLAHTPNPGTPSDIRVVLIYWCLELVYAAVGWLLIGWVKRPEEL